MERYCNPPDVAVAGDVGLPGNGLALLIEGCIGHGSCLRAAGSLLGSSRTPLRVIAVAH